MFRFSFLSTVFLFVLTCVVHAQPFSAYVNDKDEFYAMDSLAVTRIEHLAPVSYKIGKNLIAYIDNTKNFKIYQYGQVRQIAEGYTEDYTVGTDLVVIRANRMLYTYDNGRLLLLAQVVDGYINGDSIVIANPLSSIFAPPD